MHYIYWTQGVPNMVMWGILLQLESWFAPLTYWFNQYPRLKPGNNASAFLDKDSKYTPYWIYSISLWKYYVPRMYFREHAAMEADSFWRNWAIRLGMGDGPYVDWFEYQYSKASVAYLDFRSYDEGRWTDFLLDRLPWMWLDHWDAIN